jgi:hypothetical protein
MKIAKCKLTKSPRVLCLSIFILQFAVFNLQSSPCSSPPATPAPSSSLGDLTTARTGHLSNLVHVGPSPQPYDFARPPGGARTHPFTSGSTSYPLKLFGWVTNDPGDGKKHPAVVYVHGGSPSARRILTRPARTAMRGSSS